MSRPPLLYLAHRIPYPPNKGDKVRSFNLLRHLATRYSVHLACFADDPADLAHLPALSEWCAEVHCERLRPASARIASLRGLLTNEPLTLPYYRSRSMARWITETVGRVGIGRCVVFSSSMAQYLDPLPDLHSVVDFCDVDSAKWNQYAEKQRGPMAWLYRREGRKLLAYEAKVAGAVSAVTFVSEAEADLFRRLAPAVAKPVVAIGNGVDAGFFAPDPASPSPYRKGEQVIVFTGAMDYWPNVDAVLWFAAEVWPRLRSANPLLRFAIVGMNPTASVCALAQDPAIFVSGTVPDVRPYLRHASAVVAPLRIARGVQNKVLEAMACARPVVVSPDAATGIDARDGQELLVAPDADSFASALRRILSDDLFADALGRAARARVVERFSWTAHLSRIDPLLEGTSG